MQSSAVGRHASESRRQVDALGRFRSHVARCAGTRCVKRSARVTLVARYLIYATLGTHSLVAFLLLASAQLAAQTQNNSDKPMSLPIGAVQTDVPTWIPFPIQPELYWWWRKYGPLDYKVQSSKFRDFTSYNFGQSSAAAKMSQGAIVALARAAVPIPGDIPLLDRPSLAGQFKRDANSFDTLRKMAQSDLNLTRIARDFTWLRDKSNWPREDVGLTGARWAEYRGLFEKLHIQEGIVRTADFPGAIFFIVKSKGLCVAGSSSGYVYSELPLGPVTKSPATALDAEVRSHPGQGYAYVFRLLTPNWYAFYEFDW